MKGKHAQFCELKIKTTKAEAPSVLHIQNKHTQHNALPRGDFQAKSPAVAVPSRLCLEGSSIPGTHSFLPLAVLRKATRTTQSGKEADKHPLFSEEGKVPMLLTHSMSFGTAAPVRQEHSCSQTSSQG